MPVSCQIKGLDELICKCDSKILREPFKRFFERSAITVQSKARQNAPVDTGQLRSSIVYQVDESNVPGFARVGVLNAAEGAPLWFKARAMEYGTGRAGDPAVSHKSGHYPPGAALRVWASRHGFSSGYAVATAIGRRGGLKARPYLRPALRDSVSAIREFLKQLRDEVRAVWDGK